MTILQKNNNYNIYKSKDLCKVLYSHLTYGLVIVVIIFFFLGHVFGSRIVLDFWFVLNLRVPLFWFFLGIAISIIDHINVIILKCYPGWLSSQTCWPWGTFLLSRRIPQISVLWGLAGAAALVVFISMYVGLLLGVGQCP